MATARSVVVRGLSRRMFAVLLCVASVAVPPAGAANGGINGKIAYQPEPGRYSPDPRGDPHDQPGRDGRHGCGSAVRHPESVSRLVSERDEDRLLQREPADDRQRRWKRSANGPHLDWPGGGNRLVTERSAVGRRSPDVRFGRRVQIRHIHLERRRERAHRHHARHRGRPRSVVGAGHAENRVRIDSKRQPGCLVGGAGRLGTRKPDHRDRACGLSTPIGRRTESRSSGPADRPYRR